MPIEFRLFGSLQVQTDDRVLRERDFGGRKPRQLLQILLLHEGRYVAKEQLAEMLWADRPPVDLSGTIEHYVSLVRKRIQPGGRPQESLLVTRHGGYRIDTSRAWLDIVAFEELAERGGASGDLDQIEQAVALARGDILEDEPYAEWAAKARLYYSQRRQRLLLAGAEAAIAAGNPARGNELAAAAIQVDPLLEDAYRLLMTAQYMAGNQQEALLTYRSCQRALAEDAGLDPMPCTAALHKAILDRVPPSDLVPRLPAAAARAGRTPKPRSPEAAPGPIPARAAAESPTRATESPARTTESGPPPLIGRHDELSTLVNLCTAPGRFAVAVVEGESGVGKTRLLNEMAARIGDLPVVRIRCSELGGSLRGVLISDLELAIVGEARTRRPIVEAVTAPDRPAGSSWMAALDAVVNLLTVNGPFVAMIDDAQWADSHSVALLAAALDHISERNRSERNGSGRNRGAIVFACRAEEIDADHSLARIDPAVRLTLQPLTATELAPYGGSALHEQTGGLPLYVINRLAATAAGDHAAGDHAAGDHTAGDHDDVPDVLREAIRTQCQRVSTDLLRVAIAAAAMSEPFGPEPVARLLGRDATTIGAQLDRLTELRLLDSDSRGFAFRYRVVREVLWGNVPAERRGLLADRQWESAPKADRHIVRTGISPVPLMRQRRRTMPDRTGASNAAVGGGPLFA